VRIEESNRRVLQLADSHPAKRFLEAFIDCQMNCLGRELGDRGEPIDQEWMSSTDGRRWTFSGFAYAFLALDFALDDFAEGVPFLSLESGAARDASILRTMVIECADASRRNGNNEVVELADQILKMLDRWDEYAIFRETALSNGSDKRSRHQT
jgi:hypothetical protein